MNQRFPKPIAVAAVLGAIYLAVLSMAGTIALRNAALLGLVLILVWNWRESGRIIRLGWPVYAWAVYLLLFPWLADDFVVAWQSFAGQWIRSLIAMVVGAGLAALFYRRAWGGAFYLGLISAFPILVHLVLFTWKSWEAGMVVWGDWGREKHHADLGYAAGQASILLAASIVAGKKNERVVAILLIVAALLSTALARSRAGFAFTVLACLLVFMPAYLRQGAQQRRKASGILLLLLLLAGGMFFMAVKDDARWRSMLDKLQAGFLGSAVQIQCEGTGGVASVIRERHGPGDYADQIIESVRDGDGARMVVLRAGWKLSMEHPWGSDGSREAFQKLLKAECPAPTIFMMHAHNGWIDTMLAIGWIGALLYLCLLISFLKHGMDSLKMRETRDITWGLVLVACSVFWIVRGLTDSVFRDHMLEMQGFVLAYAFMSLQNQKAG